MILNAVPDGDEEFLSLDRYADKDIPDYSTFILLSDFLNVLDWLSKHGKGGLSPFSVGIDGKEPYEIRQIMQRLNNLTVDDFVFQDTVREDVVLAVDGKAAFSGANCFEGALEQVISEFTVRDRDIFVRRYTKAIADSLEVIGEDHGITRERVRQLEIEIHKRIDMVFQRFHVRQKLQSLFGENVPFLSYGKAVECFPELDSVLPITNTALANIILYHYKNIFSFEIKDGWVATPSIAGAQTLFRTILSRESNKYGVVSESALTKFTSTNVRSVSLEILKEWLQYSGAAFYKEHIILKPSKNAMILAVLSIEQRPMSVEEIAVAIQTDANIASLSNVLSSNPETVRLNKDDWGLREWGKKPYVSIRQLIYDKIQSNGGAMDQRRLIDELVDEYSLNIKTVHHYCNMPLFRTVKGVISITDGVTDPLLHLLDEKRLEYLDLRDRGGSLWVIGGSELGDVMNELRTKGFVFRYRAEGGRATKGRAAWWWKPQPYL